MDTAPFLLNMLNIQVYIEQEGCIWDDVLLHATHFRARNEMELGTGMLALRIAHLFHFGQASLSFHFGQVYTLGENTEFQRKLKAR